jgi:hypothetical protein
MEASEITEIAQSGPLLLAMLKRLANASHRAIAWQSEGAVRGHALFFLVPRKNMRGNGFGARE